LADLLQFPTGPAHPPSDAEARHAGLETGRSFIVEAPAGSGKTGLLIQRMLRLLAHESVTEPEQVLAITFTNKATAELRNRILDQLRAAASAISAPPASEFERETRALASSALEAGRLRGWALLDQPHRLNVRTIDSVCADIARTLPVLSGSGGRLTPAKDSRPLHNEAARRTLLLLGSGDAEFDRALRNLLLHRDGNLGNCQALIADMLSVRDQWGELIPIGRHQLGDASLDAEILPRLELALDHAICTALTRLQRVFPADVLDELTALAAELGSCDGYKGDESPVAICAELRNAPDAASTALDHWRALIHLLVTPSGSTWRKGFNANHLGFEHQPQHKSRLKAVIDLIQHDDHLLRALCEVRSLPPARYPEDQWAVAKSLFRVLSRALVELQLVFATRNECDFTELALLARQALQTEGGPADFALALGARLQHLLVDEMQDTSTNQYQLIELLTQSWDGYTQTVFLVGDPRQSIYLFRQARVERFIQALRQQRLGDLPLTRLQLNANFRSQNDLVREFNHDFALIFPNKTDATESFQSLPYTPAVPTLPPSAFAAGAVWHACQLPASTSQLSGAQTRESQARRDAAEIVTVARAWTEKPLPKGRTEPWKMAVLVSSRSHLKELVTALRQPGCPVRFRAVEIERLDERQEILDLTALARALLHPGDRVAVLAVLRAPWCGIPLADLHVLTGGDNPDLKNHSIQRLMDERGHLLSDDSCRRMARVWTVFKESEALRGRATLSQLVDRAWRSLGGDSWLTATQQTNARRFLQLLDELEATGVQPDADQMQGRMRSLFAEPESVPADVPYLELLTIHKAKGLEWDVVFVPSLERRPATGRSRLLSLSELDAPESSSDRAAHMMLAPIAGRGEDSKTLNRWLNAIARTREAAESKRLFYVACTRARHELHLFAAPQLSSKGVPSINSDSLLKAAWPAAERHVMAQPVADERSAWGSGFALAAAGVSSGVPVLHRLRADFDPRARFAEIRANGPQFEALAEPAIPRQQFARPEGSISARSFGNVIHACLDMLATERAKGSKPSALIAAIASWTPRIAAMLRSDGLPRPAVDRLARDAMHTLRNTLRDPDGLWLMEPHPSAACEFALMAWPADSSGTLGNGRPASIRVDRVFRAGSQPHQPGDDYLWIVDYKTTSHAGPEHQEFLAQQRATYSSQLETYARILAPSQSIPMERVRLALYFPAIPTLCWWNAPLATE
jgi:ATP-dependent helicase/nuclease subunit A